RDQRRAEVDRLLSRAALAVDRRGGRLDREALLQPRVAGHVEGLRAELLDAARDHVLDLERIDPRALDHRAEGGPEQRVRVGVLVVALLPVPAPDRRARSLNDHNFTALLHEKWL